MIKAERGRYVAAALTIIRGFMAAGSPRNADPINGYAQYCAMIRDPLIWLSCADPCATMEEIRKQDSHLAAPHQVAAQWLAAYTGFAGRDVRSAGRGGAARRVAGAKGIQRQQIAIGMLNAVWLGRPGKGNDKGKV
jgi:hypothetical protein